MGLVVFKNKLICYFRKVFTCETVPFKAYNEFNCYVHFSRLS